MTRVTVSGILVVFAMVTHVTAEDLPVLSQNLTQPTLCAEEDNVNIPLTGRVASFAVEAVHPEYEIGEDNCQPDFTDCVESGVDFHFAENRRIWKIWDDGVTSVEAVREPKWWRPRGMRAEVSGGQAVNTVHYVRLRRQIAGTSEFPEVFVLNMDGNVRLKPQPPLGRIDTCLGSSLIIGPASAAARPIAEIESVKYLPEKSAFEVKYLTGGAATIRIRRVDREMSRLEVDVRYPVDGIPFATFRSMFVADGNSDVDHVTYVNSSGLRETQSILALAGQVAGSEWTFLRQSRSVHNTSAPDYRLEDVSTSSLCADGEESPAICLQSQRFKVEVDWADAVGGSGYGRAVATSEDSAVIWFFSRDNWEMVVKVLNGCSINNRYWVFASAATTVEFSLTVTDLESNETVVYRNPLGVSASTISDTSAFATCP